MNEQSKVLVKNAGDERQVKVGKETEKMRRIDELNDIRAVLQTKFGRRYLWRLLSKCGIYNSIWEQNMMKDLSQIDTKIHSILYNIEYIKEKV